MCQSLYKLIFSSAESHGLPSQTLCWDQVGQHELADCYQGPWANYLSGKSSLSDMNDSNCWQTNSDKEDCEWLRSQRIATFATCRFNGLNMIGRTKIGQLFFLSCGDSLLYNGDTLAFLKFKRKNSNGNACIIDMCQTESNCWQWYLWHCREQGKFVSSGIRTLKLDKTRYQSQFTQ